MPKTKSPCSQTCPDAFQFALDALNMIGTWDWNVSTGRVRGDAFVALLFQLDPQEAEEGIPFGDYEAAIHADDRERVIAQIRHSAAEGCAYLAEYRVIGADGRTRWVLARGRFVSDHSGRLLGGRGILVDITGLRESEDAFGGAAGRAAEAPLDRAAEHAIAAQAAIVELGDPKLKAQADGLLMGLGRKLAEREVRAQRRRLN